MIGKAAQYWVTRTTAPSATPQRSDAADACEGIASVSKGIHGTPARCMVSLCWVRVIITGEGVVVVTPELMAHILRCTNIPEEVVAYIRGYENIRKARTELTQKRLQCKAKYEQDIRGIDQEIADLHKSCDHPDITLHCSPVDSSNNWTECKICGGVVDV